MNGQPRVDVDEMLLIGSDFSLSDNRIHRAFGDAHRAIDALIGIDDEKIRTLQKTVHRAHIHAVGIFALNTGFGHYKRHRGFPS